MKTQQRPVALMAITTLVVVWCNLVPRTSAHLLTGHIGAHDHMHLQGDPLVPHAGGGDVVSCMKPYTPYLRHAGRDKQVHDSQPASSSGEGSAAGSTSSGRPETRSLISLDQLVSVLTAHWHGKKETNETTETTVVDKAKNASSTLHHASRPSDKTQGRRLFLNSLIGLFSSAINHSLQDHAPTSGPSSSSGSAGSAGSSSSSGSAGSAGPSSSSGSLALVGSSSSSGSSGSLEVGSTATPTNQTVSTPTPTSILTGITW